MRRLFIFLFVCAPLFAKPAPQFHGDLLGGKSTSLKDQLSEGKPLLVSFWATWCSPCLAEIHHVSEELQKDPKLGLKVLTINVDDAKDTSAIGPTVKQYKIKFPVILDPKHDILLKYHSENTIPFSVLVSPKGEILATFKGYNEGMFTTIRKAIGASAGETKPPAKTDTKPATPAAKPEKKG